MSNAWSVEENMETLNSFVKGYNEGDTIPRSVIAEISEAVDVSVRSVMGKLINMGFAIEKVEKEIVSKFTEQESLAIKTLLEQNPGKFTYAEIDEELFDGDRGARAVQGKVLALKLTDKVKPTEKKIVEKSFSDAQQDLIKKMVDAGASIEAIAEKVGKTVNAVRGKALSMLRAGLISEIPHPANKATKTDVLDGVETSDFTVAELAEKLGKTERGVKTLLSRRGLEAVDYEPKSKKEAA